MYTSRDERRLISIRFEKQIGHFLQNDALLDQNKPLFKSYEHFHLLSKDVRTHTEIIVPTCGSKVNMHDLNQIKHVFKCYEHFH